ncbi:MAG TPA: indolepyruvate ferredoxin oxidoreductase family protein [Acidimicrobiales bacterium]|nr:indolepyruvate ferredoxin oxidoreductase family protein [Acidimicrobiales bacterium]
MTVTDDRRPLPDLDPGDHWSPAVPRAHLSGVQATIRLLIDALRADRAAGSRTAAFVSGYQGSPLAGFDRELASALRTHLDVEIVHQPAVNEEIAATAVMGSQLASLLPSSRVDGVLGVWYGKAPGLDRSMDALRHASFAGASATGGALAIVGDDPSAKSSTLPSASESSLADLGMPLVFPRSLEEVLDLGRHAVALSRFSGAWVAIKLATAIADAEGTVTLHEWPVPSLPEGYVAPPVSGDLLTPGTLDREAAVLTDRIAAAARYGDANDLNHLVVVPNRPRMSIVAAGIVYSELVEALRLLGLDLDTLRGSGVAVGEVRMPFPIGPRFARAISEGVEQVVVVEERRDLVENQLLSMISRRPGSPGVLGKLDLDGRPLVPRHGVLDAASIARVLGPVLRASLGTVVKELPEPRRRIELKAASPGPASPGPASPDATRVPWFCPGCPHSVSTVVPEGTIVGEGIGCHTIVHYMPEERVGRRVGLTQMGGEGAQWIGMEPFVGERHLVQNLGDGTFFHSGQLAVRAAVAAGVPITYKVLWNGATAMTGGQHVVGGAASPVDLARMVLLEGAKRVVITTDDPSRVLRSGPSRVLHHFPALCRFPGFRTWGLPGGVTVRSRDDVIAVQEELAALDGVTVLIHDQPCATELRRARKRGLAPTPDRRVVINERVCEGCGDCQVKSNCLSLQTVDTPLGPKTRIDDDTCNLDASCLKGDCPAFTLVKSDPNRPRRDSGPRVAPNAGGARGARSTGPGEALPPAPLADLHRARTVRIAGIGGTGVVTCAHLLAWAALLEDVEVWGLDQTGLSQKAGPVISDLRIGPGAADRSNVLGEGEVDLLIAADLVAANMPNVLSGMARGRTSVVGSSAASLSGPMILGLEAREVPVAELEASLAAATADGRAVFMDAIAVAHDAGAAATAANVVLLGAACQLGALPVSAPSIVAAIERNGVSVNANVAAFEAGRRWVVAHAEGDAPAATGASTGEGAPVRSRSSAAGAGSRVGSTIDLSALPSVDRAHVAWLAGDLVEYQSEALARRFAALVGAAADAERRANGDGRFTAGVAFGFHKLLAYKDEYEVARLLLEYPAVDPSDGATTWLLHPPALRARGLRHKVRLGGWSRPVMAALRSARRVRGTVLDPFGRTQLRRTERALPVEYADAVRSILPKLAPSNLDAATSIARLPDRVRGYESVKEKSVASYREELADRLARLQQT